MCQNANQFLYKQTNSNEPNKMEQPYEGNEIHEKGDNHSENYQLQLIHDSATLKPKYKLRLCAMQLPSVKGKLLRKRSPNTYARVVSIYNKNGKRRVIEWGKTEVIEHSKCPRWITTIDLPGTMHGNYEDDDLQFYVQILHISDQSNHNTNDDGADNEHNDHNKYKNILTTTLFEVDDILKCNDARKLRKLKSGCLFAQLEPMTVMEKRNLMLGSKMHFQFQFYAHQLEVMMSSNAFCQRKFVLRPNFTRLRSSSSSGTGHRIETTGSRLDIIILEISKSYILPTSKTTVWIPVYRSKQVLNIAEPCWEMAEIDLGSCCNGDLSKLMRLTVYSTSGEKRKILGVCETTVQNIINAYNCDIGEKEFNLQKGLCQRTGRTKKSGRLGVKYAKLAPVLQSSAFADAISTLENGKDESINHGNRCDSIMTLIQPALEEIEVLTKDCFSYTSFSNNVQPEGVIRQFSERNNDNEKYFERKEESECNQGNIAEEVSGEDEQYSNHNEINSPLNNKTGCVIGTNQDNNEGQTTAIHDGMFEGKNNDKDIFRSKEQLGGFQSFSSDTDFFSCLVSEGFPSSKIIPYNICFNVY